MQMPRVVVQSRCQCQTPDGWSHSTRAAVATATFSADIYKNPTYNSWRHIDVKTVKTGQTSCLVARAQQKRSIDMVNSPWSPRLSDNFSKHQGDSLNASSHLYRCGEPLLVRPNAAAAGRLIAGGRNNYHHNKIIMILPIDSAKTIA